MTATFDFDKFRKSILSGRIEWRKHTLQRLAERMIKQDEALDVLLSGECIQEYPDDKPYPSALFLHISNRPLHVVAAFDAVNNFVYIITVYEPKSEFFESDFKTRKKL